MMPNSNINSKPRMIIMPQLELRSHIHNHHLNQLVTRTIPVSPKKKRRMKKIPIMQEASMMLNSSINSKPRMIIMLQLELRLPTLNHHQNQLATKIILVSPKKRRKMRKTHIMLEALMMPNSNINLRPRMITMLELELRSPIHNQTQNQLATRTTLDSPKKRRNKKVKEMLHQQTLMMLTSKLIMMEPMTTMLELVESTMLRA